MPHLRYSYSPSRPPRLGCKAFVRLPPIAGRGVPGADPADFGYEWARTRLAECARHVGWCTILRYRRGLIDPRGVACANVDALQRLCPAETGLPMLVWVSERSGARSRAHLFMIWKLPNLRDRIVRTACCGMPMAIARIVDTVNWGIE